MTLIDRFLTNVYKVSRTTSGQYDQGIYRAGPKECIEIKGSLQPTEPRDLKMVEEGYRLKQTFKFYSDVPLIPLNTKTLGSSDRIYINGESFRVLSQETYQGFGVDLPYYKSIVAREPEQ